MSGDAQVADTAELPTPPLVIAIDGPAGSGKSTIAKALSDRVGIEYLDTGAMFRAVTHSVLTQGVAVDDGDAVAEVATTIELEIADGRVTVNGEDATEAIRSAEVTAHVSAVSAHPAVREEMRERQRRWASSLGGGVMEGRDIGTVVFPDAPLKIFLTASVEERARRRAVQSAQDVAEVEADIRRRDTADSSREHAPLSQADDAILVDTTKLGIEGVVDAIEALVNRVRGTRAACGNDFG